VPNQPDAYEFSIRTPVTPPRWVEFDAELERAFEEVIKAMSEGEKWNDTLHVKEMGSSQVEGG
jgi:hypothetical protein